MTAGAATAVLLALAWYGAVSAAASLLSWAVARVVLTREQVTRPATLLAIRLLPSGVALFFVVALFVPAHWRFEPGDAKDSIGLLPTLVAVLGASLLARFISRAVAAAMAEWRLHAWFAANGDGGPAVHVVDGLAGLTLAGLVRPLILVGAAARRQLTSAELGAALAHERAHERAFDNVKRFLMFSAPDLLGVTRTGREIEARWRAAAELLADARAVHGDRTEAVHLASALVKVARLEPGQGSKRVCSPIWSMLHEAALLELRVRRLLDGTAEQPRGGTWLGSVAAALAVIAGAAILCGPLGPYSIHQATEVLVRLLP